MAREEKSFSDNQLADLWKSLGPKPQPALPGQFDFKVDRAKRQIRTGLTLFGGTETVRVQTGRSFFCTGQVYAPDRSLGIFHQLRLKYSLSGRIKGDSDSARQVLAGALAFDLDQNQWIEKILEDALDDPAIVEGGALVDPLEDAASRTALEAKILKALQNAGIPAQQLSLELIPARAGQPTTIELDGSSPLTVRFADGLKEQSFELKARLVWGDQTEQRLGRLFYKGEALGKDPGAALTPPLVEGQIQPVEAWFRQLLSEALRGETWQDARTVDAALIERLKTKVSAKLGRGCGRAIEELKLTRMASGSSDPDDGFGFEHEKSIAVPERAYRLNSSSVQAVLSATIKAKVDPDHTDRFSAIAARHKDLIERVVDDVTDVLAKNVRQLDPLEFYSSRVATESARYIDSDSASDTIALTIKEDIQRILLDKYGLRSEIAGIDLISSKTDGLVARIAALCGKSMKYNKSFPFKNGGPDVEFDVQFDGLFELTISSEFWEKFHAIFSDQQSLEGHLEYIESVMDTAVRSKETLICEGGRFGNLDPTVIRAIADTIEHAVRVTCGVNLTATHLGVTPVHIHGGDIYSANREEFKQSLSDIRTQIVLERNKPYVDDDLIEKLEARRDELISRIELARFGGRSGAAEPKRISPSEVAPESDDEAQTTNSKEE